MKVFENVEQRSELWNNLRAGIPTASEFDKILTEGGKLSKQAEAYAVKKVTEIYLKRPIMKELYTRSINRGQIEEETAIWLYEKTTGHTVKKVGFITDDNGHYGYSPDGLIGQCGAIEVKSPDEDTHMAYLLEPEKLVKAYRHQNQGALFVGDELEWIDMWSWHADLPPVRVTVVRDEKYQEQLKDALEGFRALMNGMIETLIEKGHLKL